jgi:hypothetical protein
VLPWRWGPNRLVTGDAANEVIGISLDPNVHTMDTDLRGRRPRGRDLPPAWSPPAAVAERSRDSGSAAACGHWIGCGLGT